MNKKYYLIIFALLSFMLISCSLPKISDKNLQENIADNLVVNEETTAPKHATIVAVGDIMFHTPQIKDAYNGQGYDFRSAFDEVKTEIDGADIAIGNFETTIHPTKKPSGYPRFNSPIEVLEGIRYAGFDALVTANNHSADTGTEGIINTVDRIRRYGMLAVGTGTSESNKATIIEKNGIRIGILAYTSGLNGLTAPEGMVNIVDKEKIKNDIGNIRKDCDYLIVYVHAGTEYLRMVEEEQFMLFREIGDMGADCVLGSHPHVARQSEIYETNSRKVFINYSMGNFLSNQNDKYTDIGLIIKLNITKLNADVSLDKFEIIPVYRLRYLEEGKTRRKVILCSKIQEYIQIKESKIKYISDTCEQLQQPIDVEVFKAN